MRRLVTIIAVLFGFGALAFAAPAAMAGTVSLSLNATTPSTTTFTISGTYAASGVPTTSISASGGTYSFSFTLDTSPSLTACTTCGPPSFTIAPGEYDTDAGFFEMGIAQTTFTLNGGTPIVFNTPFQVQFYTTTMGNFGGLFICLDSKGCGATDTTPTYWDIIGQPLFKGDVSNPTFIATPHAGVNQVMSGYEVNGSGPFQFGAAAPTPEPAPLLLLGTGLIAVGAFARRKLRIS
jgi:hypothetical protein